MDTNQIAQTIKELLKQVPEQDRAIAAEIMMRIAAKGIDPKNWRDY